MESLCRCYRWSHCVSVIGGVIVQVLKVVSLCMCYKVESLCRCYRWSHFVCFIRWSHFVCFIRWGHFVCVIRWSHCAGVIGGVILYVL